MVVSEPVSNDSREVMGKTAATLESGILSSIPFSTLWNRKS